VVSGDDNRTVADLYGTVQGVSESFDRFHHWGRLSMSRDSTSTEWPDLDAAAAAVKASLGVAIQAMAWIETSPVRQ
jgi:hypothetical protein